MIAALLFALGLLCGAGIVATTWGLALVHHPELVIRLAEAFTFGDSLAARVEQLEDTAAIEDDANPLPLAERVRRLEVSRKVVIGTVSWHAERLERLEARGGVQ